MATASVKSVVKAMSLSKETKFVPIPGTDKGQGVLFPNLIHYFVGTKEKGAKVSIQLMRNGELKQIGVNLNGDPICSNPLFRVERFINCEKDWESYVKKACNCVELEFSDSKGTSEYRKAYDATLCKSELTELARLAAMPDGQDKANEFIKDELEKRSTVTINAEKTVLRNGLKAAIKAAKLASAAVPAKVDAASLQQAQTAFVATVVPSNR